MKIGDDLMPKKETEVKEFERDCMFCQKPIILRKTDLGWKPYEKNDKKHNCRAEMKRGDK